jgi:hypothetical protein
MFKSASNMLITIGYGCDSFNEQSGELSFGRIVVPLVLEPSYCSYNHSMIYNQLTTFVYKS